MDVFKQLGIPIDEIEFGVKITFQTAVVFVGILGNVYTIICVLHKSKLPRSTNMFIISLSLALMLQAFNATIDYINHLYDDGYYYSGWDECDTWHTMNVYLPMLMACLCFFCLLDRYLLLARPSVHPTVMTRHSILVMVVCSFLFPAVATVPPIYFKWYTTDRHITFRTDNECKFVTNMVYAMVSPVFTFWLPAVLDALVIVKMFKAMADQDSVVAMAAVPGGDKLQRLEAEDALAKLPWGEEEMRRQHRLAITLWSVFWNVSLFWIPQHAWLFIYKVTDADWPRATNFMVWAGYLPCLILPCLYQYYSIFEL